MKRLMPHNNSLKVQLDEWPKLLIYPRILGELAYIGEKEKNIEIGGMCLCQRDGMNFVLYENFILGQERHITTTEFTAKGTAMLADKLVVAGRDKEVENLRCWWHFHHSMSTSPSGQDDKQFTDYCEEYPIDFMVRIIYNAAGKLEAGIAIKIEFNGVSQWIKFTDVEWDWYLPDQTIDTARLDADIKEYVQEKVETPSIGGYCAGRVWRNGKWEDDIINPSSPQEQQSFFGKPYQGGKKEKKEKEREADLNELAKLELESLKESDRLTDYMEEWAECMGCGEWFMPESAHLKTEIALCEKCHKIYSNPTDTEKNEVFELWDGTLAEWNDKSAKYERTTQPDQPWYLQGD